MKILRKVAVGLLILCAPGCMKKKPEVVVIAPPVKTPLVAAIKKSSFSPGFVMKKRTDGTLVAKAPKELVKSAETYLFSSGYLPLAQYLLLDSVTYSIQDKIVIYKELQTISSDKYTRDVLTFFEQILVTNQDYLFAHPIVDLELSLVSPSPDSSGFIKDHPEISDAIWSIEDLYKQGNNLLQEAVRLNNTSAVHYLTKQGVTPRYLTDPRGPILALEWADKYGYTDIVKELVRDINKVTDMKTTLLDDLLYQDPEAAQLVQKYGGKTAVELV